MDNDLLLSNDSIETKSKKKSLIYIILIIILSILCITFIALYATEKNKDPEEKEKEKDQDQDTYIPLKLWHESTSKTEIMNFVEKIKSKENFVPIEDRIAVFDLDGTLFQETDPYYNDMKLYCYRAVNDTNYHPSEEIAELGKKLLEAANNGTLPDDETDQRIGETYGEIFKDLTLEEYYKYIKDFLNKSADGYENLKRGDAFYKPMLEVIEYLQKNDFNVYVVSGTDRYQVRTVIDGHINIPKSNVIGSDYRIKATNQGNTKGNLYEYDYLRDKFNFDGEFLGKNLKTNKIIGIIKEIGKQPILSFGNSGGDSCMANYTINNNKYPSKAFMLLCDDTEKENGNKEKASRMKKSCEVNGWIPISMEKDWKTIYGDNVKRKKGEQIYNSF